MAPPQFRTATQTRRSARTGYPEPDDFEGLPVRQWRQEWVNAAPSLQQEMTQQGDRWAVELPYGMPRESHLLPPHTQELLRAARSGRLYKRPAPAEEDEADAEVDAVKGEKKEWEVPSDGFMVKTWKQVSRNAEAPSTSHLAKRHKNTVTLASRAVAVPLVGPTVIRATVRRIDAAGNSYEETVNLAEGKQVDGQIISTTVVPARSVTQGESLQQQATPARKRPPPPKRKAKGLGRGRKKGKLPLPMPATRSQPATAGGDSSVKPDGVGADGVKIEDTEDSANQDSEMADMSGMPSEDEDGDGGDGEGDDERDGEGGEGVNHWNGRDGQDGETPGHESVNDDARSQDMEDSEMSEIIQPSSIEEPDESHPAAPEEEEVTIHKVRLQPPSLANLAPPHATMYLSSARNEGSPLKNVMILSPTDPSPLISPSGATTSYSASGYLEVQSRTISGEPDTGDTVREAHTETAVQGVFDAAGQSQYSPPVANAAAEEQITIKAEREAIQPPEALPPTSAPDVTERSATPPVPAPEAPTAEPAEPTAEEPSQQTPPPAQGETQGASAAAAPEISLQPPDSPALLPTVTAEDEDDGLNLLGSLERELDRQEGMSNASSGSDGKITPTAPVSGPAVTAAAAAAAQAEVPVRDEKAVADASVPLL